MKGPDDRRRLQPRRVRQPPAEPPGRVLLAVELGPRRRQQLGHRLQADYLPEETGGYFWVLGLMRRLPTFLIIGR